MNAVFFRRALWLVARALVARALVARALVTCAVAAWPLASAHAQGVSVGAVLTAPSGAIGFGRSVDTDGTRLVVGSIGHVHVYESSAGTWAPVATLSPFGAGTAGRFGDSVAILGDYLAVGAPGAEDDDGAVYVFHRAGDGTWTGTQRLTESPASSQPGAVLGLRVRLEGTTLVTSGPWYDRFDGTMGRVVFFERDGAGHYQQVRMLAPLTTTIGEYSYFGFAMDFRGGTLAASNWLSREVDTWTYAFDATAGVATLTPVPAATYAFAEHATSVALGTSEVLVGSHDEPGRATFFDRAAGTIVLDPTPAGTRTGTTASIDGRWAAAGALPTIGGFVTTFHRDASGWVERRTLRGLDAGLTFGTAVLVRGNQLFVGESYGDTAPDAGLLHLYTLGCSDDVECGAGGFCTDGVCCNARCDGACDACVELWTGLPDGTCGRVSATVDAGPACVPVDAAVVDGGATSDAAIPADAASDAGAADVGAASTDASHGDGAVVTADAGTRPRPALDCTCHAGRRGGGDAALLGAVALALAVIGRRARRAT